MPYGKEDHQLPFRKMVLIGNGEITAVPDLAILQLGVQTNGENVTTAQTENARISQNVINSLKQLGITDIKTIQYQVNKIVDYENGKQIDRGYQVQNIIEIRTDNLADVGTVIDTAVYNGANVVNSISFSVKDPDLYYKEALNLAVDNAIQKAQTLAFGLGITINPIPILITENSFTPTPFQPSFALRGEIAAVTPVEPGKTQIKAAVTAEFIY